jgi:L-alanine-DL-glutamate epimerase-like enolase superfamily enzyme
LRISEIEFHKVNIPFEAPLRWSGGVEDGWTRCIIRMRTDDVLASLGGRAVKAVDPGVRGAPLDYPDGLAA